MLRLLPAIFAAATAYAQISDPVFSRVPFDQWTEAGQSHLRWHPEIAALGLTDHQRLLYRIQVKVDGAEMVKRRGKGRFLVLVEFRDSQGRTFQAHGAISLRDVKDEASRADLQFQQNAFLMPGEYRVALAVYVTGTREYALARRTLHVDPLPHDPLAGAWRDLPPVEFVPGGDPPDAYFLPTIQGKLNLPIETRRRVEIDLMVNATPSEEPAGRRGTRSPGQMLGMLLPSMKTLAQLRPENGSMNIAMLDLARQKVTFQSSAGLDWEELKNALAETNPHMIDVGSLEKQKGDAQFFVKEIARRLEESRDAEAIHALIVLSAPMAFIHGEDLHPIEISADRNCKVFYLRYSPSARRVAPGPAPMMARRGPGNVPLGAPPVADDSLERTLKPLNPRLFDVTTPAEFRKALAVMIEEIGRAAR